MRRFLLVLIWPLLLNLIPLQAQQLAFPGAEGYGRFTTGGRGGEVYEVTNLNDSGEGSLRSAVEEAGTRTIIFRISGTIHLLSELRIRNGNITIAGQTAPGDGIAFKGHGVVVDADNVIIRYLRFRPGDISGGEPDAIWGRNHKDIIIDHCSMSWSVDEASSFYDNENFTMQWCLLSESLYESQHEKGRHGYGGIWGGQGASFHHNILAHHSSRNPRFNGSRYSGQPELEIVDFRNNVIYNWGGNSAYGGEGGNQNMVANYYKAGPATSGEKRYRIVDAFALDGTLGKWHVEDNYVDGYPDVTADNWNGGVQRLTEEEVAQARVFEPFPDAGIVTQSAQEAYESVLADCGANSPKRDEVDARIINEVATGTVTYGGSYGTMKGIIDSQDQLGGWPELFSALAPEDNDHDGMPDTWELENTLDPEDSADGRLISDNGYTNLENYLNELINIDPVVFLKHPTDVVAQEVKTNSIELTWSDNSEREENIVLERSLKRDEIYTVVAELPANTTSFLDEGLDAGTAYIYRLKVVAGEEYSAYSSPVSFRTLENPIAPDGDQLVAHWPFDASVGVLVRDESRYRHNGELVNIENPGWIPGKMDNGITIDDTDPSSHILMLHANHLTFDNSSFTVSFWIKALAQPSPAYLFHKGTFNGVGKWYGLEIKDDMIRFAVDDDMIKSEVAIDNTAFLNNEWVHVAVVRDTQNKTLSLYRNGEIVESVVDQTQGGIGQAEPLIIANSSDLNTPFIGSLDDFKIYNYSLNASEITGIFVNMPVRAYNPSPGDNETDVDPTHLSFNWSGDADSYNFYLGESEADLSLHAEGIPEPTYVVSDMTDGKQYFWRVDAVWNEGTITGDIWSFTTRSITGVDETGLSYRFNCYPNPVNDKLNIELQLEKTEPVEVLIYDIHSRLSYTVINSTMNPGLHKVELSDGNLPQGTYFLVLKTTSTQVVKRIVSINE